jgi:hypothetical protein
MQIWLNINLVLFGRSIAARTRLPGTQAAAPSRREHVILFIRSVRHQETPALPRSAMARCPVLEQHRASGRAPAADPQEKTNPRGHTGRRWREEGELQSTRTSWNESPTLHSENIRLIISLYCSSSVHRLPCAPLYSPWLRCMHGCMSVSMQSPAPCAPHCPAPPCSIFRVFTSMEVPQSTTSMRGPRLRASPRPRELHGRVCNCAAPEHPPFLPVRTEQWPHPMRPFRAPPS